MIHDVEPTNFDPTIEEGISFYHPEDQDKIEQAIQNCMENGEPYEKELRLITADDRLCWVQVSGKAIREDGEIVCIRGVIQDITEQKEYEQELNFFKELIENAGSGITVINKNGRFEYVNYYSRKLIQIVDKAKIYKELYLSKTIVF